MIARPTWDLPFDVGEEGPRWPPGWPPPEPNDPGEGSPTPRVHAPEGVDPRWEPDDGWVGDRDANPGAVTRPEEGNDGGGRGGDSRTEVPSSDPWTTHSTSDALLGQKTQSSGEGLR